jgi:hypothetical protein
MIITLTDRDGVIFDINSALIAEIHGSGLGAELILETGESVYCKESASMVMKRIIESNFGGIK